MRRRRLRSAGADAAASQQTPTWQRSWLLVSGALVLATALAWAGAALWWPPHPQGASLVRPHVPPAPVQAARVPSVSTLHEQAASAYHARLFVDDEAVVLITQTGFTTLRAGSPPEEHAVSLGPVAVRQGGAIVFWRSGQLRSVSLSGAEERELAEVPRAPQFLLASAGQVVWIQTAPQAGTVVQTLSGGKTQLLHSSEDSTSAAVLHGAFVYWVSETRDGSWAIRRIGLDGRLESSAAHRGRPPAMLAAARDGVYFYAGSELGVRRLSPDLQRETSIWSQVICSPLAASSRVVCAQVGGLFDIPRLGKPPRPLATERAGPITALAATDERAYWVAERGGEGLVVRSVSLSEP